MKPIANAYRDRRGTIWTVIMSSGDDHLYDGWALIVDERFKRRGRWVRFPMLRRWMEPVDDLDCWQSGKTKLPIPKFVR